jgi:release factor glutamine methyltransferase
MSSSNVLKVLNQTTLNFQERGFSSSRLDAEVLLSTYLKTDQSGLYANFERLITDEELNGFLSWVKRRQKGEPVAYITGRKEFWSLSFEVNPEVLVPRPETELLVEEILKVCQEVKDRETAILEVGTGSGAISVAVASDFKKAHIVATDTSIEAIKVARKNAAGNGVKERISFLHGNLFEPVSGKFDIIVSNPPYISEEEFEHLPLEVKNFEPKGALLAGSDGTEFHDNLIREGSHYLKSGGWLFMEIGAGQKGAVEDMLRKNKGYDCIGFKTDYGGIERVAMARRK